MQTPASCKTDAASLRAEWFGLAYIEREITRICGVTCERRSDLYCRFCSCKRFQAFSDFLDSCESSDGFAAPSVCIALDGAYRQFPSMPSAALVERSQQQLYMCFWYSPPPFSQRLHHDGQSLVSYARLRADHSAHLCRIVRSESTWAYHSHNAGISLDVGHVSMFLILIDYRPVVGMCSLIFCFHVSNVGSLLQPLSYSDVRTSVFLEF